MIDRTKFYKSRVKEAVRTWAAGQGWTYLANHRGTPVFDHDGAERFLFILGISGCTPHGLQAFLHSVSEGRCFLRQVGALPDVEAVWEAIERFRRWHPDAEAELLLVGTDGSVRERRIVPAPAA